jgi:Na+/H+ antiporter NhaD/arsenite permease-like protein
MTSIQIVATIIFIGAYLLIASERIHKTTAALSGAALMLLLGVLTQEEAFHGHEHVHGVDWNTILLLIGMMTIVAITKETGVFEWIAIKSAKMARGRPMAIIALLSLVTAVLSALLDNVTTVLLVAPVAIVVCRTLETDPVPFLICCILASNIGGTATLIGDPPNIMIASVAGLTFVDFLKVNGPVIAVVFAAYLGVVRVVLGPRLQVSEECRLRVLEFDESKTIHDPKLLAKSLIVIGLTLTGFMVHGNLELEPATIALAGAALLLLLYGKSPTKILEEVEWPTIFFFMGLFIMVSGLVKVGVVRMLAAGALDLTGGHTPTMTHLIMWLSAVASGIVDNIPFVATMNSLVVDIAESMTGETGRAALHDPSVIPLWWALSLGACLGGNMTLVGASANVVVAGIAAGAGHPITFVRFLKYGIPITIVTVAISTVYVWLVFLR